MAELFATGRIIDLILVLVVLEAAVLALMRGRLGDGMSLANIASMLVPGACLLVAVRAAMVDAWWGWAALALTAALFAHLFDVLRRWHA